MSEPLLQSKSTAPNHSELSESRGQSLQPHQETKPTGGKQTGGVGSDRKRGWLTTLVMIGIAVGCGYALHGILIGAVHRQDDTTTTGADTSESTVGADTTWTCSMHPQIQKPNPGKCPICAMDMIPVSETDQTEKTGLRELSISREARELLDIRTTPIERRYVTANIRMDGKVAQDETRRAEITAWVPGRLERMFVDYEGAMVQKGDHLVSIYSPELYSTQKELIQAVQRARQEKTRTSSVMNPKRLLESAREKLRLWGLTKDQIRDVEQQDEPSDVLTIYAPISGVVHAKHAEEGMYVDTGSPIYALIDLSQVWVKLDAYESDLTWLRYGQEVTFTTEAYPGEEFSGRVAYIDHMLTPQTRTVKVRLNVSNPSMKLKPGMFVRATVRSQVATTGRVMEPDLLGKWICRMHPSVIKKSAGDCDICGMPLVRTKSLGYVSAASAADQSAKPLVVPASAVLKTGVRAVVYVQKPEADQPTYEGREIVLGPRAGDFYIVRSGLEEGERVVTHGTFKIDSALQIVAKPSMMNPDTGLAAVADSSSDDSSALHAPPSVTSEFAQLQLAAQAVHSALETEDRSTVRDALRKFERTVSQIKAEALQGQAALFWNEMASRLRNDAVEGRWAATDKHLAKAVDQLQADMKRLRNQFGLPDDPNTLLAGGPFRVPETFREKFGGLWNAYTSAQHALVQDDPVAARQAAHNAEQALTAIQADVLNREARSVWSEAHSKLHPILERMQSAENLDDLRSVFADWSAIFSPVIASFGPNDPSVQVVQHECSMALDNEGAFWFQVGEEVHNPYMGQFMPKCTTGQTVVWDGPPETPMITPEPSQLPEAFQEQLGQLWKAYQSLQEDLASDDLEAAAQAVDQFDQDLAEVDASTLNDELQAIWDRKRNNLRQAVKRMRQSEELEPIRAGFALLSEEMPVLIERFRPILENPVYQMHCPMAFDGRGAAWLQSSKQVRNPYFGSAMIQCATEIKQIATADQAGEGGHNHE